MNERAKLYAIGELARRTGLSVRTIRFYSDLGLVPPTHRTHAGYRLYDIDALARLDLVRTLRELGIDLDSVGKLLSTELTLAQVAAAHADALEEQIRALRLRRAVLRAVLKRGSDLKEAELMHKLARLSERERRQIIDDFFDEVFAGLDIDPDFAEFMRSARPELPDDPSPEQVEAWVEFAELVQDPDFRASVRQMTEGHAQDRAAGLDPTKDQNWADAEERVFGRSKAALTAGVNPRSDEAGPIVDEIVAAFAETTGRADGAEFRRWVLTRTEGAFDERVDRYWSLLARINGWPPKQSRMPEYEWFVTALRHAVA